IGVMFILATVAAYIAHKFRQPHIPAYIITGLLIGPVVSGIISNDFISSLLGISPDFSLITNKEVITTLSEIGIAFLLFIVGLEINLKKLKDIELVAGLGGTLQITIMFLLGFGFAFLIGSFTNIECIYIGLIIALSSTMVVMKLLSDRHEIDTLHGRIIVGILLIQDIAAIFSLLILSKLGGEILVNILVSISLGAIMLFIAIILSRFVFPGLFKLAAKSNEILLLCSLSICFLFSIIFSWMGYSIAVGAFIAGITLGNLPYNIEIIGRVKSLRDFFATLFFVSLGMQLPLGGVGDIITPILFFLVLIILVKPFVIMMLLFIFGYKKRTSFLSSISLAQISEFSLILLAQGMLLGHVSEKILTITIILAVLTIALSSYLMKYEYKLYSWISGDLSLFERIKSREGNLEYIPHDHSAEVLLCGYNRTGYSILEKLNEMKKDLLVIDFNPEVIKKLIKEKIPCIYGDISNIEVLNRINFNELKFIISTAHDPIATELIIKKAKHKNKDAVIFVTAYNVDDALSFYDAGADYVILPHFLGGYHASVLLEEVSTDVSKLITTKNNHIDELNKRRMLGHTHPISTEHNGRNKYHI
ncbi:cation:proton antiporter, partial [Candidatus Woesearchaeota archaeon]|nr:cation:proton antiporter [Candidatus Woesearchaeota archaeon]